VRHVLVGVGVVALVAAEAVAACWVAKRCGVTGWLESAVPKRRDAGRRVRVARRVMVFTLSIIVIAVPLQAIVVVIGGAAAIIGLF
jgi:uncharacterized membrane protein